MSDSKKENENNQKGLKKTIYLDKEALEKVSEDADGQDRSVSYIINAILRKFYNLDKKDKPGS
ncbi:MAG: hypothetical protein DHS20C13_22230 [Thermodesulfobacteriota bacterium]|nr:MAG: hypothetical protein DHS20C13_22230 [Thermodesulfobacteriota bacterium]GJM35919.1 MAG: hypothetical protein DHS20C18_49200 [Saprospiraceae bacterium]